MGYRIETEAKRQISPSDQLQRAFIKCGFEREQALGLASSLASFLEGHSWGISGSETEVGVIIHQGISGRSNVTLTLGPEYVSSASGVQKHTFRQPDWSLRITENDLVIGSAEGDAEITLIREESPGRIRVCTGDRERTGFQCHSSGI